LGDTEAVETWEDGVILMSEVEKFQRERDENIRRMGQDPKIRELTRHWLDESIAQKYSYGFSWLGRPIIQYPQDMIAMQEILWRLQPDLVIETGVAHGGSLIFYASILELLGRPAKVVGIDIDIREHNRLALESHPLSHRLHLIEGSSLDPAVVQQAKELARDKSSVLVVLDSNHTHEHVLRELELYSPLVSVGSYLVVFDTIIEDLPESYFPDRPWGPGDNPRTAVRQFLAGNDHFVVDERVDNQLLISAAPGGYLLRTGNAEKIPGGPCS